MCPEGVEVRLSCELIIPIIREHVIIDAYPTKNSRYGTTKPEGYEEFMKDMGDGRCYVKDISVHGKFMWWTFNNGWYMFCTFGMTGQWSPEKGKHPCFVFQHIEDIDKLRDYKQLFFNDPRHFGTIKFTKNEKDLGNKLDELGWDPLLQDLDSYKDWLVSKIQKSNLPIGQILLDQSIFSGVGNYIRAEALYSSRISPWRVGSDMNRADILSLCQAIVDVMQESYTYQGATIQTYKTVYGEEGRYSSCFKVYGKRLDPFGRPVISKSLNGRTIHWCPQIQT